MPPSRSMSFPFQPKGMTVKKPPDPGQVHGNVIDVCVDRHSEGCLEEKKRVASTATLFLKVEPTEPRGLRRHALL